MKPYSLSEQERFPFRPKPFFFITTHDREELTREKFVEILQELKDEGFGGIVLFNKPQNGFDAEGYLSDDWFAMVEAAAQACRELDLPMWINDGFDFPPGDVAGRVRKLAPELTQKHLAMIEGKVTVLEADWGFPAFEEPKATELFIALVYEEYKKRLGEYFGDPIVGFFSDTDNRRVRPPVMFNENSPMRNYFPWSDGFSDSFRTVYGYAVEAYLPDILARRDIPQAVDYWEHAGRLMQEWFAAHHRWLTENGLEYTGHTSDSSPYLYDEAPRSSCFTEGRFSDVERNFDYPGTDQELYALDGGRHMIRRNYYTPHVIWGEPAHTEKMPGYTDITGDLRAKQAEATRFQYGKKGVMCEMFAATNYGVEPWVLKQIAAYQIMQGVTFVVPHAYHYRFAGETKYFAPPDFSSRSLLSHSVRELNDWIAALTAMMAKGEPIYPIALIDPTEYVWRGVYREAEYFDAFARLNRLPYGFTLCDTAKLLEKDFGFRVVMAAGIDLPDDLRAALTAKGLIVLDGRETDRLAELLPDCTVSYTGEGTPHFARRIIDGREVTFIANIESIQPIRGKLTAYGREKEIVLYPGDVCYLSADADNIPDLPCPGKTIAALPEQVPVRFHEKNLLPLEIFREGVLKTEGSTPLHFDFSVEDCLDGLTLGIPDSDQSGVEAVMLDGAQLLAYAGRVYDEAYRMYSLSALEPGAHTLTICRHAPFARHDRILLTGEFDAEVVTDRTEEKLLFSTYNLKVYAPARAEITLRSRRTMLSLRESWANQGQPFYSGSVTYALSLHTEKAGRYRLTLPRVRDAAVLCAGGQEIRRVMPPYRFELDLEAGENELSLTVTNSLANAMEDYREESGVLAGGEWEKI